MTLSVEFKALIDLKKSMRAFLYNALVLTFESLRYSIL